MLVRDNNQKNLEFIFNKYGLTIEEKIDLLNIIKEIYVHDEFQKRMTSEFKHHGEITLGMHILEDAVITYLLSKKYVHRNKNYNLNLAVKIAMLHDLYTVPWQNNVDAKTKNYFNEHGFRHPLESVINANAWYPKLFQDDDSEILIDGIVHHMFPYPVTAFKYYKNNENELKNFDLINKLSKRNLGILINSSNRNKLGSVSISKSLFLEGRVMSKADKKVSFGQIRDYGSAIALITGRNKNL